MQKRQQAADTRETVLSGLKLTGETLGQGIAEFLGNRKEMTAVVLGLSAAALGIYSAKIGTGIMGRYVEVRFGRCPRVGAKRGGLWEVHFRVCFLYGRQFQGPA